MTIYKIGDLCKVIKGTTPIQKATPGDYPLVVTAEDRQSSNEYQFDCEAVCVPLVSSTGHGHASIKRIHYQEGKFALGSILAAIIPCDNSVLIPKYLYTYLSTFKDSVLVSLMKGSANVSLTINSILTAEIEVPTAEIQEQIIESVENIQKYNSKILEKIDKQRVILKQFRQSVLQEAILGKLVPQNSNDEPTSLLLHKMQEEKERFITAGKIKRQMSIPKISIEETPYELPDGWEWVRLENIVAFTKGSIRRGPFGSAIRKDMFVPKGNNTYKVYEQGNAISKDINIGTYYINEKKFRELESFAVEPGDIIISCAGTIGEAYLLPENSPEGIINQALLKIRLNTDIIRNDFFLYLFKSLTKKEVNDAAKGSAMKNLVSIEHLKTKILFPVPPLAEQKRIVEKVDQLMGLCDEMEKRINQLSNESCILLQSVLQVTFKTE